MEHCKHSALKYWLVISAAILISFFSRAKADEQYGSLDYISSNGEIEITGLEDESITDLVIPDTIAGLPVTSIGDWAFDECDNLTSITIPNSVTRIGDHAFSWCSSLTGITIPDSVTTIDDYAFNGCIRLKSITIPESVTSMGDCVFRLCEGLINVTIPNSITSIGENEFQFCYSLKSIIIPASVTTIGSKAFSDSGIVYAIILSSNTKIVNDAFDEYAKLIYSYKHHFYASDDIAPTETNLGYKLYKCSDCNLTYKADYVDSINDLGFYYVIRNDAVTIIDNIDSSRTTLVIPAAIDGLPVTTIAEYAFAWCEDLTNIIIPDSVTTIEESAFEGCASLTSITIPASVKTIDSYAFSFCTELTDVLLESNGTSVAEDAFKGSENINNIDKINFTHIAVIDKAVAATCTSSGLTEGSHCKVCGEVIKAQKTVNMIDHKYTSKVTPATSTTMGYTTYTCSVCGYYYDEYYSNSYDDIISNHEILAINNVSNGIKIKWENLGVAKGYYVYRKTGSSSWKKIATVSSGSTVSYIDKTVKSGTKYSYQIVAYNGSKKSTLIESEADGKDGVTFIASIKYLAQPTVTLTNASNCVKVTWSKTTGASGYYVYRKVSGAKTWTVLKKITSGSTTSYLDKTAKAGTTYYYTVKAYSGTSNSSYVTDKTIKRLTQPVVTLSKVTKGVKVAWKKITGASGYYVYRKTASGSWSKIKTITSGSTLSYTDTTGKNGTTYYYTVRAYSGKSLSSYVTNKSIKYKK
jgi:fibronectin type 3 domain-containing protein